MIHYDCQKYCGDEDCNKCSENGYIYSCAGCEDYIDYFGNTPNKRKEGSNNESI